MGTHPSWYPSEIFLQDDSAILAFRRRKVDGGSSSSSTQNSKPLIFFYKFFLGAGHFFTPNIPRTKNRGTPNHQRAVVAFLLREGASGGYAGVSRPEDLRFAGLPSAKEDLGRKVVSQTKNGERPITPSWKIHKAGNVINDEWSSLITYLELPPLRQMDKNVFSNSPLRNSMPERTLSCFSES